MYGTLSITHAAMHLPRYPRSMAARLSLDRRRCGAGEEMRNGSLMLLVSGLDTLTEPVTGTGAGPAPLQGMLSLHLSLSD